ncbi:thioredoxin-like protein [Glomus cerebriforme]|uniref:Thioredoxin-like protein n=1 Tax=Glomus cerebriforme TaxID=658196 RepID=A0A397T377_9GLOM|nr:thioredoxin-like protein [Glomus cerebriforme]
MDFIQDQDDLIGEFCNITNATKDVAITYLEVSAGDVEQAITLYLESGGYEAANPRTTTNPQHSTSATSTDAERTRNTFESDAELARALAQEESSTIRAPIAPKRDILVGGDQNDHVGLDGGMIRRGVPRSRRSRDNTYRTFAGDALPHRMGPSDEKATRLADLFSPPFDIINKENFERTRNRAKADGKWLMVDIQNIREFSCQVLNRDLWRDKTVKDVIKAHFLFLQYNSESPDGRQYINYYPIDNYPHIAIIDPRTGERVRVWNTQLAPTEFIISVTDFLERYSLTEPNKTPKKNPTRSIVEMSEEEQIRTALKKSLEGEQSKEKLTFESDNDEIEDTEEEEDDSMTDEPISTFDSIKPVEREEAQGPTSAMIKFRLADGQTIIRRFEKLNPVRYLFEFIKATVPNLKSQEFELVCHRNNLINQVDQTIEEAGLSNSLVNVVLG